MTMHQALFEQETATLTMDKRHFATAPLYPADVVASWGPTFAVAAHPAEIVPRWGGTLALLRWFGLRVHVLICADGVADTEQRRYPAGALRERLEDEELAALDVLGITNDAVTFLHISGFSIPTQGDVGHEELVALCGSQMAAFAPQTILLPWRRSSDHHAAAWDIGKVAAGAIETPLQLLESVVHDNQDGRPREDEVAPLRIDTAPTANLKRRACELQRTATAEGLLAPGCTVDGEEWECFLAPRLHA